MSGSKKLATILTIDAAVETMLVGDVVGSTEDRLMVLDEIVDGGSWSSGSGTAIDTSALAHTLAAALLASHPAAVIS